jgi:NitT/TauT family transport system permease protein
VSTPVRRFTPGRVLQIALPLTTLALGLAAWQLVVTFVAADSVVLPGPGAVGDSLIDDRWLLLRSFGATLLITLEGFLLATLGGIALAILFNVSRIVEYALYPYAVILQVTPVLAIAPLLLIWLSQPVAVLACAWLVAFFPVLANTTQGLNSVDHNLIDLYRLYGASPAQILFRLKLPSALPSMLTGLRIAGGLSLVGAVVAELSAGSAGAGSGLAYRIVESAYRENFPRMYAALILLSVAGVVIYFALAGLSHLLLRRWHESALSRER